MLIVRPALQTDLDAVMGLIEGSGPGLTSLPKDEEIIRKKLIFSEHSFKHQESRPAGEYYLFVMEDTSTRQTVGICGIIAQIGSSEPYYFNVIHQGDEVYIQQEKVVNGPAEVCSLYLSPEYRKGLNGRLLSLSRFMFIAINRHFFQTNVIAELRGDVSSNGTSPFWEAVGKKYTNLEFDQADYLLAQSTKFVEEKIPAYKIFVKDLPEAAQSVIGKVHPDTVGARIILEREGFKFNQRIGILEPGPVVETKIDQLRIVNQANFYSITAIVNSLQSEVYLIAKQPTPSEFAITLGMVIIDGEKLTITKDVSVALKLKLGEQVWLAPLKVN